MRILTALAALACAAAPLAAQSKPAPKPATAKSAAAKKAAAAHDSMHAAIKVSHDSMHAAMKGMSHDSMHAGMKGMQHDDHDMAVAGGGTLPSGWAGRTDGAATALANVKFAPMGAGLHLTLGPATILWRDSDAVNGHFHTLAKFTQTKAPMHPEGYGLFVGGKALNGEGQKYIYFLVRGDGVYLIKKRDGANTSVVQNWTASPAVNKADAAGKATNLLEVATVTAGKLTFKVNGQEVYSMDVNAGDVNGAIGIRANHNLDLHIDDFAVHKIS